MNYRQLEVFRAVMQTGSVTAAAAMLKLTQPAVTKILRHAESQLKFALFERVRGRLVPTSEAHALLPNVERIFDDLRIVRQTVDALETKRIGALAVVTTPTLGAAALPRVIAAFHAARPGVRLDFEVCPRREIVQRIAVQRADLGFAFLAEQHANVRHARIATGRIACVMRRDDPLSSHKVIRPFDLKSRRLVSYAGDQGLRPLLDRAFAQAGVRVETSVEVNWVASAWAIVNEGMGIALVDTLSQLERLYPGLVTRPFEPAVPVVLEVLNPEPRPISRLAAEFIRVARETIAKR